MSEYDSTEDTKEHIARVNGRLEECLENLAERGSVHDKSKLEDPEKSAFDVLTPRLKDIKYGSDEYRSCLREMKPALRHHYDNNSHHPEHYLNGIDGMSLMDLVEMLCDWKAAGERHDPPNSIFNSIEQNTERFKLSPQLVNILTNTVRELKWE